MACQTARVRAHRPGERAARDGMRLPYDCRDRPVIAGRKTLLFRPTATALAHLIGASRRSSASSWLLGCRTGRAWPSRLTPHWC